MNGNGISRADIDRASILDAKVKEYKEEVDEIKDLLKSTVEEGGSVEGFNYMATLSKAVEVKGKPDYRAELIKAIGDKKVLALESAAAQEVTVRSPSVKFTINPNVSDEDQKKSRVLRSRLMKAIGEGKTSKEIVAELKEVVAA